MKNQKDCLLELAEQAGLHAEWFIDNPEIEQFAELIVRECAKLASEFYEEHDALHGSDLLNHFGIEK